MAHLAEAVVRGVVGLLWSWKDEDDDEPIKIQEIGRAIGLRALRTYVHAKGGPQLSPRLREIEIDKLREQLSLRHITEIGFHLTNALNIAVPGLLQLHPPRKVLTSKKKPRYTSTRISLSPEASKRFGLRTLFVAAERRIMSEPPLPWRGRWLTHQGDEAKPPKRGGYRGRLEESLPLIRNVPVSEADPPCSDVVYDALNVLQTTPWRVNCQVLAVAEKFLGENLLSELERRTVQEAQAEANEPELYFIHSLDYRGRVYAHGLFLTPSGPDIARALITFAGGRLVEPEDIEVIRALDHYGEECYGATLDQEQVGQVGRDPNGSRSLWWSAKEKKRWQYLAYCLERTALAKAFDAGVPYLSTLPVWQDASANGLQHMALLLRDEALAKKVNIALSDHGRRGDIYSEVAQRMTERLRESSDDRARSLLKRCGGAITRQQAKLPTMTFGYGATKAGFHDSFAIEFLGAKKAADGRVPWNPLADLFAKASWRTLQDAAGSAVRLRDWLDQVATKIGKSKTPATWRVPGTGFPAGQRRSMRTKWAVLSLWWGKGDKRKRHRVRAPVKESSELQETKHRTSFAPNVIHSLDAAHLMLTVTRARASNFDTPLATVHDSFATCAADAPVLESIFKGALVTIYGFGRNPLRELADQLRQQCPTIPDPPRQGTLDVAQVFLAQPLR